MLEALQVLSVLLAAVTLTASLAHALELPGKLRLSKDSYFAVQTIYYPGFTWAGGAEVGALVALLLLTVLTRGTAFWLILAALICLACAHAIYWVFTHPVNNFWLRDFELKGFARGFFSFAGQHGEAPDWRVLRDRWEYSHVARAALTLIAFTLLITAVVVAK